MSSHIADDRLVDLALGEATDPAERDHLAGCNACTEAHSALLHTVATTRHARPDVLVSPPPRVWDAIRSEISADRRTSRSRTPVTWLLAAACILGIVLGVAGTTIAGRIGSEPEPSEVTVASASLAPLDSAQEMGVASLVDRDEGLRLDVPDLGLDPGEGFLEVWLINRDLTRMVSVGVMPVDAAGVVLPVSQRLIDEGYVIVDISREPFDDEPAHSGDTLVRGELST